MNDPLVESSVPIGHGDLGRLERYRELLNTAEMAQLLQSLQRRPIPGIRINTLKIDVNEARRAWPEWYGWKVQPVPFCAEGWQVTEHGQSIERTLEHKMGFYYIQDAASMLPVEMYDFDSEAWPLVLDMAASPGGKTTHLACKLKDRGLIVANDSSWRRIAALRSNLQDWGTIGTVITNYLGERFGNWFPEVFDKVLLDAPCSGESLRTAERRRSRPVSAKGRQALHQRQVSLLTSAFQALNPGGQVVYATCTLAPEEDEAVLDALLSSYPHQAAIEAVDHVLAIPAPGLRSDGEREFHAEVRRAIRLWPHLYDTCGFFAALISKRGPVSVQPHSPPRRPLAETGFKMMTRQERAELLDHLLQAYGFDLGAIVEQQGLVLWKRGQSVYAIPEQFLSRFGDLPCIAIGILIGEQFSKGLIPSHQLIARFGPQFTGRRLVLSDEQIDVWLAGQDLRGLGTLGYPLRAVILLEDDKRRVLGRGKVLSDRIRNMLPRRLIY